MARSTSLGLMGFTGATSGQVLARVDYNPAVYAAPSLVANTVTTWRDFDATNLAITFVAPASGRVRLLLSCALASNAVGTYWRVASGGVGVTESEGFISGEAAGIYIRYEHVCKVTGLTPNTSYTWTWQGRNASTTQTANLLYGTNAGDNYGAAVMEVSADTQSSQAVPAVLGSSNPAPLGPVSAGSAATAARSDHVHAAVLPTGTATLAPALFTAGTNLTAPTPGAEEYDGKAFYLTPASGRGVSPSVQLSVVQADFNMTDAAGVQACLPAVADVLTVQAGTTYLFEGQYIILTGATTHTTAMAFALATTTITSWEYLATLWSAALNTIATATSNVHVSGVASKVINATSTAVYTIIEFRGVARINAGGTITPQINFSAATGATPVMKVGSYMQLYPVGSGTVASVGPWA